MNILAHLSHRLMMSYCDPMMSIVPHQSTICFKQHFLLNHLVDCHQTSQYWSFGGPLSKLFKEFNSIPNSGCHGTQNLKGKNFKNLLVKNYWSDFKIIWYKWSLGDPVPKLFYMWRFMSTWKPRGMASFCYVNIGRDFSKFWSSRQTLSWTCPNSLLYSITYGPIYQRSWLRRQSRWLFLPSAAS